MDERRKLLAMMAATIAAPIITAVLPDMGSGKYSEAEVGKMPRLAAGLSVEVAEEIVRRVVNGE